MSRSNYTPKPKQQTVFVTGRSVEVKNGDVGKALRKFKRKIQDDGILQTVRERQHYEKPSETRKKAKAAARARWMKKQRKLNETDF